MKQGLICFDLDGTLIDSVQVHNLAYQKAFKRYGYTVSLNTILKYHGLPGKVLVQKIKPHISQEEKN